MGMATRWQDVVIAHFKEKEGTVLNPRRDDWNASWIQSIENPKFYEQVVWELDALDSCDIILMYFDPKTKSPISLLELGLHAESSIIVCCPPGFWRKGNVDIVCERYQIPVVSRLEDAIYWIEKAMVVMR